MNRLWNIILVFLVLGARAQAEGLEKAKSPIYSPAGKRDPFRSPAVDSLRRGVATVNPLEKYSVDRYQLKAVLKGIGKSRAMFEDPEGKTYILSEAEIIGRERAVVSRILNTEVIITERTFNYLGNENLYERVLTLPQEAEAGDVGELEEQGRGNRRRKPALEMAPSADGPRRPGLGAGLRNPPPMQAIEVPQPAGQEIQGAQGQLGGAAPQPVVPPGGGGLNGVPGYGIGNK